MQYVIELFILERFMLIPQPCRYVKRDLLFGEINCIPGILAFS